MLDHEEMIQNNKGDSIRNKLIISPVTVENKGVDSETRHADMKRADSYLGHIPTNKTHAQNVRLVSIPM